MKVVISRNDQDKNQTTGTCEVFNENSKSVFKSKSLERGWRNNEQNVSCIPLGEYPLVLEYSNRFKQDLWEIKQVDNRSECKFHAANYWHQLNGCIALGEKLTDINNDNYKDVTSSRNTMAKFHKAMGQDTKAVLVVN